MVIFYERRLLAGYYYMETLLQGNMLATFLLKGAFYRGVNVYGYMLTATLVLRCFPACHHTEVYLPNINFKKRCYENIAT